MEFDQVIFSSRNQTGLKNKVEIFGRRVVIPTFEVFSSPTIRLGDIKSRRFNLIDRAVQTARQQLMAQEDEDIFKALDSASESGNKDI